jgi:hypothetical protein
MKAPVCHGEISAKTELLMVGMMSPMEFDFLVTKSQASALYL